MKSKEWKKLNEQILETKVVKFLEGLDNRKKHDKMDSLLRKWINISTKFIRENKNILFTRADKGNSTIAIHREDYESKMNKILEDKLTYRIIDKDPTNGITNSLKQLISRWKNKGYIDQITYKSILVTDGVIPRAYGLSKLHKEGNPCRIVVSTTNSPLHKIALFLHKIIKKNIHNPNSYIKNSFELVNCLKNVEINSDMKLASFDVVSLYSNIPIDLAINSLKKR